MKWFNDEYGQQASIFVLRQLCEMICLHKANTVSVPTLWPRESFRHHAGLALRSDRTHE